MKIFRPASEENSTCEEENEGGYRDLRPPCTFIEDAPDAVRHHGQGKCPDKADAPFGEIMIAEKYPRKHHHRHGDGIDEPVPDLGLGGV